VDWDNDKRKDLILGERNGTIRIYLNTGTDANPAFSGYTFLQRAGSTYDAGYTSSPYIIDWNNDKKKDVLCGDDGGYVFLLLNEGTDANPVFNTSSYIQASGVNLDVGSRASPVAVDWDQDGKKDLLIGETYGSIRFYPNVGTDAAPVFTSYFSVMAGGSNIDVGYYSRFDVVDWNGDNVMDLMCGFDDYYGTPQAGLWFFRGVGPLWSDKNVLSRSSGGTINFVLDAGASYSKRLYFLLGSASGTSPGTVLPSGNILPLNRDFMTNYIIANFNNSMLQNFRGILDQSGMATATFDASSIPPIAGDLIHFAFTTEKPYSYQSQPVGIEVVP